MKSRTLIRAASSTVAIAALLISASSAQAATLKSGTCRGISTSTGYKYVGTYCVDFQCTTTVRLIFDSYCPYEVDV